MEEQNIQEKNIVGVGRMTAGFILRVIGYTIVFAIIWGIIGAPLARGLASILMNFSYETVAVIMKIITPIIAFGGGLFIQYFVCKWSTESVFSKKTLEPEKIQNFYRNIIIYFFACVAFVLIPSVGTSALDYILGNVIPSLLYMVMIPIQKKFIEKQIEGADIKINNKAIAITFVVLVLLGYAFMLVTKPQRDFMSDIIISNSDISEESEDENNSLMKNKYANAKWEKLPISHGTSVRGNIAWVDFSLSTLKENTVEKYKVVKVICTIYKESNNKVIGQSETFYENVELGSPYENGLDETIAVELSHAVGNDFTAKIEAYGVEE